jgi:ferric-dicitrate binding protein FerR (iron transport regulator)
MNKKYDNQSIQEKADQLVRYYKVNSGIKKEDALNIILSKIEKQEKPVVKNSFKIRMIAVTSVAASIAIAIVFYLLTAQVVYKGVPGNTLTLRLPDHSRVVLDDKSELTYKKYFWNRKVELQGKAYFEVQKGNSFIVAFDAGTVQVLGTRFLVSENNNSLTVQCFEGKVKTDYLRESVILTKGMQAEANNQGKLDIENTREQFPDFAVFNKNYSGVTVDKIAKDLESFFGISVSFEVDKDRRFSGSIESGTIENAMEILTQPLQLNYKINSTNQFIIYKN